MAAESLDWRQEGDMELREFMPVYGDLDRLDMIHIVRSSVEFTTCRRPP